MAQQKVRLDIPKDLTPSEREILGVRIAEHIAERTRNGTGYDGRRRYPLSRIPYTKAYAEKKGVSQRDVDLTLTGDMLDSLDMLTHRSGSVTVGFEGGTFENDKAEGNGAIRPFLGITKTELQALIREVRSDRDS